MPSIRKLYKKSNGNLAVLGDSSAVIPGSLIGAGSLDVEFNSGAVTPIIGATDGTYGTPVVVNPDAGHSIIEPSQIVIVWGGTFGSETATLNITVTYSDTTTASQTSTATSTGTTTLSTGGLTTLLTTGKPIVSISLETKSTINSSTVTTSVTITGVESQ